jgi:hypothetical protein
MKPLLRRAAHQAARNELAWTMLDGTVMRLARYLDFARRTYLNEQLPVGRQRRLDQAVDAVCADLRVKHGVFAGMRYPELAACGSSLPPKLLGSYERELQPTLDALCREAYTDIVNVGCGEGYYAVGLALRIPTAEVHAFDIDDEAIRLSRAMATLNGVQDRVHVAQRFDEQALRGIRFTGRGLILADCEGCERDVFTAGVLDVLAGLDLVIEVHDFLDLTLSGDLRRLLSDTHAITAIESLDDIRKAQTYDYPELAPFDLDVRREMVGEFRPAIMEWLVCRSRRFTEGATNA